MHVENALSAVDLFDDRLERKERLRPRAPKAKSQRIWAVNSDMQIILSRGKKKPVPVDSDLASSKT